MAEVPHFDTGAWSLYQPGQGATSTTTRSSPASWRAVLAQAPVYCTTAQHFEAYLKTPPVLTC